MRLTPYAYLVSVATAHTIMQNFNGNARGAGIYMPSQNNYISDVNSNSLACNGAPVTGFSSSSTVFSVQAGSQVTGQWLHELGSTGAANGADNKVIDSTHKGPISVWMKKVSDATQNPSSGPGSGWFKIAEEGLSNGKWGVDNLISAGGVHKATIPSCIANGDYLVRFEILALHSAYNSGGAQFYMECAQVRVTGGSGAETPSTVSLPGAYKSSDPGITVQIYNSQGLPYPTSYTIPGPRPFVCSTNGGGNTGGGNTGGGNDGGNTGGGSGGSSGAELYGQCGGAGWSGPTTCKSGKCTKSNDFYSQCIP